MIATTMHRAATLLPRRSAVVAAALAISALTAAEASAAPPNASFTFTPSAPLSGETVTFDSSASSAASGETIVARVWDLDGDGQFDDGGDPQISSSYPTPGPRTVRLRVTGSSGESATTTRIVNVGNRPPTASFEFFPRSPRTDETVSLFSTAFDPDGPVSSHEWDLDGDGEFDDAVERTAEVEFERGGEHTVGLRVVDSNGAAHEAIERIEVVEASLSLLSPFPVARLAGELRRSGNTAVTRLSVRAPKGTRVEVRCKGGSCPVGKRIRKVAKRNVRFPAMESVLKPGVVIKVFATKPKRIGKYTRFKIRPGKAPKRADKCLRGASRRPVPCPRS